MWQMPTQPNDRQDNFKKENFKKENFKKENFKKENFKHSLPTYVTTFCSMWQCSGAHSRFA